MKSHKLRDFIRSTILIISNVLICTLLICIANKAGISGVIAEYDSLVCLITGVWFLLVTIINILDLTNFVGRLHKWRSKRKSARLLDEHAVRKELG